MVKYVPGDVLEVPERFFRTDIMEKVLPPAPKPTPEEVEIPTETEKPDEIPEVAEPKKEPKKRRF